MAPPHETIFALSIIRHWFLCTLQWRDLPVSGLACLLDP
jgi:hypothetical protein